MSFRMFHCMKALLIALMSCAWICTLQSSTKSFQVSTWEDAMRERISSQAMDPSQPTVVQIILLGFSDNHMNDPCCYEMDYGNDTFLAHRSMG